MTPMTRLVPAASGFQIAFFIFAVVFLATPLQKYGLPHLFDASSIERSIGRFAIFVPALVILLAVPGIRRFCWALLREPVRKAHWPELGIVLTGKAVLLPFAYIGGVALYYWITRGEMGLARWVGNLSGYEESLARATSVDGILFTFLLGALIGPVIEELVFRGMLYRAWEATWGWFASMIATSAVFAAYHAAPVSAFLGSIVFVVLYRRTGSLWACILAHAATNLVLWYPLLGQFIFRKAGKETGEIESWPIHLAALAIASIAVPAYVWLARSRHAESRFAGGGAVAAHA